MAKVLIHATMSLDGFIAGPRDEVDWSFQYGTDAMIENIMSEIGAVIIGNRGFREGSMTESAIPYGGMVKEPQFVVTHEARDAVSLGGLTFEFVEGIDRAVEKAKSAAGKKSVALLGASIDQQCLTAGLVDEILIHMVPILLGEGIRLFDHLDSARTLLERMEIAGHESSLSSRE